MAQLNHRRLQNISGEFYVDRTCIDCDTCRWMAPAMFNEQDGQSAVYHQPVNQTERLQAMQALLSCPTASIGTVGNPTDVKAVQQTFPIAIADSVYHCGYHAEASYAATSYLIVRPEGNVLVDSPRYVAPLVKRLEEMGGIRYMYLTHRDDVADHEKFHQHFGCDRILHQDDITSATRSIEIPLAGAEPITLAPDLFIIPTPGHTRGHTVLLYSETFLFSGDHLAWSEQFGQLIAFRNTCWYSWSALIDAMQRLATYSFEWVLPGHGRRYFADRETMQQQMQKCLEWIKTH
jgi:glyoxylase-like metal-dependent hydrolase (beta-lactamase superfamily II)/ferredoxin